jgi:hypothetical protein
MEDAAAVQRFWEKVDVGGPDECWEWKGERTAKGYGRFDVAGRHIRAHRFAWELAHGPIPEGMFALHHCDNPPCCNPAHLFEGTNLDNMADMTAKRRAAAGERHGSRTHPERVSRGERRPNAKLTEEDIRMIRFAHSTGRFSYKDLATCYAINWMHVRDIVKRKYWKHV